MTMLLSFPVCQYSDLEQAISTLVSGFHQASGDHSATLKTDEFKNLLSSQMPNLAKVKLLPAGRETGHTHTHTYCGLVLESSHMQCVFTFLLCLYHLH